MIEKKLAIQSLLAYLSSAHIHSHKEHVTSVELGSMMADKTAHETGAKSSPRSRGDVGICRLRL